MSVQCILLFRMNFYIVHRVRILFRINLYGTSVRLLFRMNLYGTCMSVQAELLKPGISILQN